MTQPRRIGPAVAMLLGMCLALTTVVASTSAANAAPSDEPATGGAGQLLPIDSAEPLAATAEAAADFDAGSYVVVLKAPPAAAYTGGIADLNATDESIVDGDTEAPAVVDYVDYLGEQQTAVADAAGVQPTQSYTVSTNGFTASLTAEQAAQLSVDSRVARVVPNEILQLAAADTSTGYLGLEGPTGVWADLGGADTVGTGVVVGVIDTGIAPENTSFAGDALDVVEGDAPYLEGDTIVYRKSDGTQFRGVCQTGEGFTSSACSTKIVGARYFVDGFGLDAIGGADANEYVSPRDGEGHGSHTAGTAAGNPEVPARDTSISGVTPQAKIAAYKACWSGPDPGSTSDDGCATADLLAAIDAATLDGVDVINYSIGGESAQTTNSVIDEAFMVAASSGIFVAAAAGNSGPSASTLDNASPWITTVAASTIPAPEGTIVLGDGQQLLGTTVTVPETPVAGPLVLAENVARTADLAQAALCAPGTLDPDQVAGTIVVCDRGVVARTAKSAEVLAAGGIGMVLVNTSPSSLDVDDHVVPTVHVDSPLRAALRAYAATADAQAELVAGNQSGQPSPPTPQVAGFSSRGPVLADGSDLIKPDIAAPGTTILAPTASSASGTPTWGYLSGTSMASPHVAGLAALYLSQHPNASPAEIKSAIMTTASDTVDATGADATDPFVQGAGQVEPTSYLDPGLVYLNDRTDWTRYVAGLGGGTPPAGALDASDLNLASIGVGALAGSQTVTRTVTSTAPGTYTASVSGLPGVETVVTPASLTFDAAGEQAEFQVTFTRTTADLDTFTTGFLEWTEDTTDLVVRSPIAVQPTAFAAPSDVTGTGSDGSVTFPVQFGEPASYDLQTAGLARGSRVNGTAVVGGPTDRYAVGAPEGTDFIRIDLDAVDDTANLDVTVYQRFDNGGVSEVASSSSVLADEQVLLDLPFPGTYLVEVVATAAGMTGDLGYTLSSYVLDADAPTHPFEVSPNPLAGDTAETPDVTASWQGLPGGSHLGVIGFGTSGAVTMVVIDAGAATPVPGSPTLTVSPTADEWLLTGTDLRVTATGLVPGATYEANIDGGAVERSGVASEDGTLDWLVSTAGSTESGQHQVVVSGPGLNETRTFQVAPLAFIDGFSAVNSSFTGTPLITLYLYTVGEATVDFSIARADTGEVVQRRSVLAPRSAFIMNSGEMPVEPGDYTAVASITLADGSAGPSFQFAPITATAFPASSITLTPPAADGMATVTVDNLQDSPENVQVEYRSCDGTRTYASDTLPVGASTEEWNLAGVDRMTVRDRVGQPILTYDGDTSAACTVPFDDPVGQNLWTTLSAADRDAAGFDAERPITAEVGYRYEPTITQYGLDVIEERSSVGTVVFRETVRVDAVTERGPVSRTTTTVAEDVPGRVSVLYFISQNGNEVIRTETARLPAITAAELVRAGSTVVEPGTATLAGTGRVGEQLSVDVGAWTPADVVFTYQWLLDGEAIEGATGPTYEPVAAEIGRVVTASVTGTASDGSFATTVTDSRTIVPADPDQPGSPGAPDPDPGPDGGGSGDGGSDDDGSGDGGSGDDELAMTGMEITGIAAVAVLLLVVGAVVLRGARRRSS